MPISYDPASNVFHLRSKDTSYVFKVFRDGYLIHLYWGRALRSPHLEYLNVVQERPFSPNPDPADRSFSLDTLHQEYPVFGNGDFGQPALELENTDGSTLTDLRYRAHRVFSGKPALQGLPATWVKKPEEAQSLEIDLCDDLNGLQVTLLYTVFEKHPVIARSVRLKNAGSSPIKIKRVLSASLSFTGKNLDLIHLPGAWARERYVERQPLMTGLQSVESSRGTSSHQHNPFIALALPETNDVRGDVWAWSLVYSGNFLAQVEVDQYERSRVQMGINPSDFSWLLGAGEEFQSPECLLLHSTEGTDGMSLAFHHLFRENLIRSSQAKKPRPVLINNWEGTYFDFDEERIVDMARVAHELGIELFVLDDGWFGKRDRDDSSLGDWYAHVGKIPHGIEFLAERITAFGIRFGLWFEPEMVSADSNLYRDHPDWCLHVAGRRRTEGRSQLVLDFSRPEVVDHIYGQISTILTNAKISYVKWDMNRHLTEVGSAARGPERQRETAHRYTLGVYSLMERLCFAFPDVLFEGCSGGGGRFDPGILFYMPQIWTSDNTDAVERLKIQYGTSLVYPPDSMGSHVSAVPNHQLHRSTPLQTRAVVSLAGVFGYELDLNKMTPEEKTEVRAQTEFAKSIRELTMNGDFYRLLDPFDIRGASARFVSNGAANGDSAWVFVSQDKKRALLSYVRVLARPNAVNLRLHLKGLDPEKDYRVKRLDLGGSDETVLAGGGHENDSAKNSRHAPVYGGDALMWVGLPVPNVQGDFASIVWELSIAR